MPFCPTRDAVSLIAKRHFSIPSFWIFLFFSATLTQIAGKAFVHRGFERLRVLFILTTPSPNPHHIRKRIRSDALQTISNMLTFAWF